jgi:hypothetical protein
VPASRKYGSFAFHLRLIRTSLRLGRGSTADDPHGRRLWRLLNLFPAADCDVGVLESCKERVENTTSGGTDRLVSKLGPKGSDSVGSPLVSLPLLR